MEYKFEYHTYLHHSQTPACISTSNASLNTIHIYIILKQTFDSDEELIV